MPRRRKPEVMSPAGYWPQLQAAIEAGADAVYFGLKHFTARAKVGFSIGELPEVTLTLHRRGVRGYLTFNTLVFAHEIEAAARALAQIAEAGTDAIIVQDLGVLAIAREVAPGLEIHASTQMSVSDAAGARLAHELGVHRVTLARELSLDEIRAIRREVPIDLEVFVHGALCVAYSGQCFSSEAWGGRSANRGQCAQACRLPYELYADGALQPLGDARYLLSPGDLYALRQVPELIDIGIDTFKIEGRYKDADYVAAATQAYRKAVDEAWAGAPLTITPLEELQLEQVYSRGLGPFFLSGVNHQAVVQGRAPRHRGVCFGKVVAVERGGVLIEPSEAQAISPLKNGDGLVFDSAGWRSPEQQEEGGRLYSVEFAPGGALRLRFANDAIRFDRIRPGDLLWRTDDPALQRQWKPFLQAPAPVARQGVEVEVHAAPGEPLVTHWRLSGSPSLCVTVRSAEPLVAAQNRALDEQTLTGQFGRLGGTPYRLEAVALHATGNVFAPSSQLNQVRREAVERLQEAQCSRPPLEIKSPEAVLAGLLPDNGEPAPVSEDAPRLHLLIRAPAQLEAALESRPASITLDYLDLYGLKPSVERVLEAGVAVRVASPRILKPGEERITGFLMRLGVPLLVRPFGLLMALRGQTEVELTGDFSLNAANAIAARTLLDLGLSRLTPTHDLNAAQVTELARDAGPGRIEAIAYQHLPVFHTEHCVFCRFLSTGTSYKDCGRPCDVHRLELGDPDGRRHPVMADVGCRNTVFGAEAQEASAYLADWRSAGILHYRLEFVHESASQVASIAEQFARALSGRLEPRRLSEALRDLSPQGSTQGSLFVPAGHPQLPILQ